MKPRPWFRFSLVHILATVAVCAVLFASIGWSGGIATGLTLLLVLACLGFQLTSSTKAEALVWLILFYISLFFWLLLMIEPIIY